MSAAIESFFNKFANAGITDYIKTHPALVFGFVLVIISIIVVIALSANGIFSKFSGGDCAMPTTNLTNNLSGGMPRCMSMRSEVGFDNSYGSSGFLGGAGDPQFWPAGETEAIRTAISDAINSYDGLEHESEEAKHEREMGRKAIAEQITESRKHTSGIGKATVTVIDKTTGNIVEAPISQFYANPNRFASRFSSIRPMKKIHPGLTSYSPNYSQS